MCEFISWIEHDGKNWFLTKNEINSDKGKELIEFCGRTEDLVGHGAIRKYYGFKGGFNRECTDFSTPENFPKEIVQALKDGLFEGLGLPLKILTTSAKAEYDKIILSAWAEYDKIRQAAWAEYDKIEQPAKAEYDKIVQPAKAEYDKIVQPAKAEYDKIRQAAEKERQKKIETELAEQKEIKYV